MNANTSPDSVNRMPSVSWLDSSNLRHADLASPDLLDREIYLARKLRTGNKYPGKRSYSGLNYFSAIAEHVWYESLFERDALLWLDFHFEIVAIASQPMRMDFSDGTHHYPDFIALHSNNQQVVYDVRPASLLDDKTVEQFSKTKAVCTSVGWGFRVISEFEPAEHRNLRWLSNFRQRHCAPPAAACERLLSALAAGPLPLIEAADALGLEHRAAARSAIYHLIWSKIIHLDLTRLLSDASLIERPDHDHA